MKCIYITLVIIMGGFHSVFSQVPSINEIAKARSEILKEFVVASKETYMVLDSIQINVKKVILNGTELLLTDNSTDSKLHGMFIETKNQNIFISGDIWDESAFENFYQIAIFSKDWKKLQLHWMSKGIITNQISLDKLNFEKQSFECTVFYIKKTPCKRRLKIENIPIDQIADFNSIKKRISEPIFRVTITELDIFSLLSGEYPAELDY